MSYQIRYSNSVYKISKLTKVLPKPLCTNSIESRKISHIPGWVCLSRYHLNLVALDTRTKEE